MDLNVRNYDDYLANIQIFKALDEKLVSYESNVDRILYDRCLDLLSEIFNEMKFSNLQRVVNNWQFHNWQFHGCKNISVSRIISDYAEILSENMLGYPVTKRALLEYIIYEREDNDF